MDRAFGFGYVQAELPEAALEAAGAAWDERGVRADDNYFNVIFFGTIGRQFDFQPVMQAARMLQQAEKRVRFVVCGTGSRVEGYRAANTELKNVLFPGWVGAAEIRVLMRRSAIGLAPYNDTPNFAQSVPNKPAEYLSGGLPTALSLRHGILYDLIQEEACGFSYGGDANRLVQTLCRLEENRQETKQLSDNARAVFAKRFVAEKVYGEMMAYLQEVIAATRAASTDPV